MVSDVNLHPYTAEGILRTAAAANAARAGGGSTVNTVRRCKLTLA